MIGKRPLRRFRADTRGIAAVEFGIIAPVLCVFIVGAFDIAHTLYMRSVLQGALQKAARDTALEIGNSQAQRDALDVKVRQQVAELHNDLKTGGVTFSRRYYRTFTKAGQKIPETLHDENGNGLCDNSERFDDVNSNGVRDADGGDAGQGGAKDAVLYTVSLEYDRIMPVLPTFGWPNTVKLSASTILKNQPYAEQGQYAATTARNGTCPA